MTPGGLVKTTFSRINRDTKVILSEIEDLEYYMHNSAGIIFPTDVDRVAHRMK